MGRVIFGLVIGILNVVIYSIASGIFIYALIESKLWNNQHRDNFQNFEIVLFIVLLISCLIMTLVSGLLIAGILKKNYQLIRPWLYLSLVGVLLNIIGLIINSLYSLEDANIFFSLLGIALQILIWYPIFSLYKDIKAENLTDQANIYIPPNHPFNTIYNPVTQSII